jgi:hypothetical protein
MQPKEADAEQPEEADAREPEEADVDEPHAAREGERPHAGLAAREALLLAHAWPED